MTEKKENQTPKSHKYLIFGIIVIMAYDLPWLLFGIIHWLGEGFDLSDLLNVQFLTGIFVSGAALGTSFHLWSWVPKLEDKMKKLFFLSGFTFTALLGVFTYLLINIVLQWQGYLTVTQILNQSIPDVSFEFFYIKSLKATMPADSFVIFALILLAITFYLYPMEKYVKQKLPWHTISMFAVTATLPILILFVPREFPGSILVMSILTSVIVLWVLYNFFFLFYLYFSTGLKSPKGTALRKAAFMIGFGFLLIIFTWVAGWSVRTGTPLLDFIIQMGFGASAIVLFNYGFYLIKPES